MYCSNCGKEIADDSMFCRFCGNKLEKTEHKSQNGKIMAKIVRIDKEKVYIGHPNGLIREFNVEDLDFIPEVGKEVELYTTGDTNVIIADGKYNYVEKCTVNKNIYCLIILFLGGPIGLHKFYAKKHKAGLLYLAFCWTYIPLFIALFYDLPKALFKKADRNGNIKV